jgi:hypothetical protein
MVLHTLRRWLPRSARPQKRKPIRSRPRCAPSLEALEDRVVPAKFVDLGPLRFGGDFTQDGDNYSATGIVQLGLAPVMTEDFTPLVNIATNAGGSVAFTVGTADPTFTVTNAAVAAALGSPGTTLWQTTDAARFDVASLIGGGVSLTSGGQPFAVAGATFTLDSLAFFNPGGGGTDDAQVRLHGGLTVAPLTALTLIVGGADFVTIDAAGVNLNLVSGPVSGSLTLGGLAFDTAGLQAAYDAGGGQFVLSGPSSFQLEGNAVGVTFGNPGLVVADGFVQQVRLALAGDLTVGGLTFSAGGLPVTYTDSTQTYTVTGDATVTVVGQPHPQSLTVVLGGGDTQGLVITNGALTNFDMTYQGNLMLQTLEVQAGDPADPLTIAYTPGSGEYTLTGPIAIETLFGATATLGESGQDVLKVRDGSFDFVDFNLSLSDVNLGAFTITTLQVAFTPDSFSATLDLMFPNNWAVGGTVGFLDGKLNDIGFNFQSGGSEGIEIADTGIQITGFCGKVQNLQNPADLIVSGSLTATWGTAQIFTMTGGFTVSKDELVLDADVNFLDGSSTATGTLTLDWGAQNYELQVSASWYYGLFTFEAVIDLSDGDELYVRAEADVNVPQFVPFIGGDRLASVDFVLEYHGGQPLSDSFVAGWVDFLDLFEVGVKVDFNGNFSVIGSGQIQQLEAPPPMDPPPPV